MDRPTPEPGPVEPTPAPPAAPAPPLIAEQPQARLFGIPVIFWALIVFVIIIVILAWFDLVGGDIL